MCNHAHRHTLGVAPAGGTAFAPRRDDMETNAIAYAYCFRPDTRLGRRRDVRLQRRFRLRWGRHRSGLHDVSISEHVRSPYARIQTLHTAVHSRVLPTAAAATVQLLPCFLSTKSHRATSCATAMGKNLLRCTQAECSAHRVREAHVARRVCRTILAVGMLR